MHLVHRSDGSSHQLMQSKILLAFISCMLSLPFLDPCSAFAGHSRNLGNPDLSRKPIYRRADCCIVLSHLLIRSGGSTRARTLSQIDLHVHPQKAIPSHIRYRSARKNYSFLKRNGLLAAGPTAALCKSSAKAYAKYACHPDVRELWDAFWTAMGRVRCAISVTP